MSIQQCELMSKLMKSENSALKFDTSLANLNCFIRPKSKQRQLEGDYNGRGRNRKKARNEHHKQLEFQDKAFLQSVVCKILNDQDCQGITELIDNMVFPSSSSGDAETSKDHRREELQQQQISQLFCEFPPIHRLPYPQRSNLYGSSQQQHPTPTFLHQQTREDKQERTTTIHSSFNSFCTSPRENETNPEMDMLKSLGGVIPIGYPYNFYQQPNPVYQRQVAQRKRRTVSGEEAIEYRIIPQRIEADGRTTLMIRHIPNKYSQEMLLQEIGKVHKLRINFLYLPIDHYNSCNVGYAFANFIHTKFILQFYRDFNGRRWDRYNSEKICELAYARIQGTTNLMDHFQTAQGRGRAASKGEQRKKSNVQLDDDAIKDINKMLDHQRVEK